VFQLTTCVRFPEECTDDVACGRSVHRSRTRCLENRDSMALLAAIFTGANTHEPEGHSQLLGGKICLLGGNVHTLYCLEEWRGEEIISPLGDNFTLLAAIFTGTNTHEPEGHSQHHP
jgi:hypothetical protein